MAIMLGTLRGLDRRQILAMRARASRPRIIQSFPFRIKGLVMPIYAYRCASCGHAKDVLQKISDPVLSRCPACGAQTFVKQVTSAGFQLKGSGWYVTDFKGEPKAPKAPAEAEKAAAAASEPAKPDTGDSKGTPAAAPAAVPAAATTATTAAAPSVAAPGSGTAGGAS
jgi:putative FmdB family regulatory protein